MHNPENILLIRNDRLGDLILSLPVAATLKDHFPDARISYLAARGPSAIHKLVDYVDNWLIDSDSNGTKLSIISLTTLIKRGKFDCSIELKPSWRTSAAMFLAGIPRRIGTSRRAYSIFHNQRVNLHRRASGLHQTDLDLAMLQPLGISSKGSLPILKSTPDCIAKAEKLLPSDIGKYIVIHPGHGGSAPNWPIDNYILLAELLSKEIGLKVVITGEGNSESDFEDCVNLSSKTDLEALAGVISRAELFISGSTGPLHLADALGKKCLSFFSNRDDIGPDRWGPRKNMANILIPENKCQCKNLKFCRCLEQIQPQYVLKRIRGLLGISFKELGA